MEQHNQLFDRLIPHLILNYHFAPNAGLLNGKMGGVVFFGQYAQYTGKNYFREYAEELLDEVFDMVHENVPIDFVNGLCGIGWGVEYLLRHSLMEGDADEVLEDIDKKIIERDPLYVEDLSLYTGLWGIMMYITARLAHIRTNNYQPFPFEYLKRLQKRLANISSTDPRCSVEFKRIISKFNAGISGRTDVNTAPLIISDEFYGTLPNDFKSLSASPIGVYQGLTGIAFKLILL